MIKTELTLTGNSLTPYNQELIFEDGLPVVAGYLRVSSDLQVDEGHSLETQRHFIREACAKKFPEGCHLIVLADEGVSGMLSYRREGLKPRQYRQGLTLVTELIERRLVQYVCVYKCNRLSRSPRVWFDFKADFLEKYEVELFAAADPVGNRDSASAFITDILMASAAFEHDNIRLASKHGMEARIEAGYMIGSVCYGWQWQDSRKHSADQYVGIEPNPKQAAVLLQMVEWYLLGKDETWIAIELERQGIPSPNGQKSWDRHSLYGILINPRHRGFIKNQRGELIRGAHFNQRLIDETTYHALVERRKFLGKLIGLARCSTSHIFIMQSKCGICGHQLNLRSVKGKPRLYRCNGKKSADSHKCYSVQQDLVEKWVVRQIQALAEDLSLSKKMDERLKQAIDEQDGNLLTRQQDLKQQLDCNENKRQNWANLYRAGEITEEENAICSSELASEHQLISQQMAEIQSQLTSRQARALTADRALSLLGRFADLWKTMPLDEKRALADYLIEEFVFTPQEDYVQVELKLLFQERLSLRLPYYGRGAHGRYAIQRYLLVTAHHLLQKSTPEAIAKRYGLSKKTIDCYCRLLVRITGVNSLDAALEKLAPIVRDHEDELRKPGIGANAFDCSLSEQDVKLLRLLSEHLTDEEMAIKLGIHRTRVVHRLKALYFKLGAKNTAEAVSIALKRHLITDCVLPGQTLIQENLELLRLIKAHTKLTETANLLHISTTEIRRRLASLRKELKVRRTYEIIVIARERRWIEND